MLGCERSFTMILPVFPNFYPYNDMLLDGHLQIGRHSVKTRSYPWSYRGPVLLYNSTRTEPRMLKKFGYQRGAEHNRVIVGVVELVDSRELTVDELKTMVCRFNRIRPSTLEKLLKEYGITGHEDDIKSVLTAIYEYGPYVAPLPYGYFFTNRQRFPEPVQFNWPSGPVRPILTQIAKNSKLYNQLQRAGIALSETKSA